jgi:hypothetical protein
VSNDQVIEEGGILLPNFVLLVHKPAKNDVEMSDQRRIRSSVFKLYSIQTYLSSTSSGKSSSLAGGMITLNIFKQVLSDGEG